MKKKCSLCNCSVQNKFIPTYGTGNKDSTIAWVSSFAPSKIELKLGTFSSPFYDNFNNNLVKFNFNPTNLYFTHIIKCKLNRLPTSSEANNCVFNLLEELKTLPNLKIIVLMGNSAFSLFTNLKLSKFINIPIFNKYVLIGIPHYFNISDYDLSVIKKLYNLTI